jgi:hypothetical protein
MMATACSHVKPVTFEWGEIRGEESEGRAIGILERWLSIRDPDRRNRPLVGCLPPL